MPLLPGVQPPGKGATVSEPPPGAAAGVSDTTVPGPLTAGAASVAEGAGVTTFPAVVPGSLCAGAGAAAVGAGSAAAGAGAAAVGAGDAAVVEASVIAWPGPGAGDAVAGACVTGAMTVSHANDSYFWVVTNFGEMKPEEGYKTQTLMTLIIGIAAMIEIFILSLIF